MTPDQLKNSVGIVTPRDFLIEEGLKLQCGQVLAPINIRYETYGTLSEKADNAILLLCGQHPRSISAVLLCVHNAASH